MKVTYTFHNAEDTGYGIAAAALGRALNAEGIETSPIDDAPWCDVAMWMAPPPHVARWRAKQRRVLFTMWETDHIPITFSENIHDFTTVLVPSRQNAEMFGALHPDVRCVALGIDPVLWKPRLRHTVTNHFEFLLHGAGQRKATDVGLRAFARAFPERHYDVEPWLTWKTVKRNNTLRVPARVHVETGWIPAQGIVDLYANAHCVIAPSRGEGFGMMPLQAIAQGCPTILTDAHGHADFARLGIPIATNKAKAGFFLYGDAGTWWEPTEDELIDVMRDVYANYELHRIRAEEAAKVAHETYTWAHTARAVSGVIGESDILNDPGDWVLAHGRRYLLRVNQRITPSIGGTLYEFSPGNDYWTAPDVRRIIQEAGYLDETCLADQTGRIGALV